ncbi:MAG: KAP family NTPase [Defluviitaleaceae bacterium]|nr:KAP family NTPase [Defluviitaleaceae bacterium]
MKNFSTKSTVDAAMEMFERDALGRNAEIASFINLLDAIDEDDSCTIALNGDWGSGKTFFVKQTKLILDCYNDHSDLDEETRKKMQGVAESRGIERTKNYATVYYDAWANDNAQDPILSLVHSILKANHKLVEPKNRKNVANIFKSIVKSVKLNFEYFELDLKDILEGLEADNLFEELLKEENIKEKVKEFINSLIEERGNRLVIFVDELDRCKPAYAIQLLERIKHYFDDERIIFVFSVNLGQLQHTVKGYYGAGFDATRYLDKFFDLRISLPEINYEKYFNPGILSHWGLASDKQYELVCLTVIEHFKMPPRLVERYISLVRIANGSGFWYKDKLAHRFAISYFVPVIIGLSVTDLDTCKLFLKGQDPGPLQNMRINLDGAVHFLLGEKENNNFDETILRERLIEAYYALFDRRNRNKVVGKMTFSNEIYESINKRISLLSAACKYNLE